ncbi:MAG: glycosyltransferase family 39 protein [Pirellulales bacterium]|nr:glycosyltransferase family 39 protein [Pirellulales bacterium]
MVARAKIVTTVGLILFSGLVQAVLVARATVPSLDAVWFAQVAQEIEERGMGVFLAGQRERPLFPLWAWSVHEVARAVAGPLPASWALSVQLAAAFSLVLAVVPVYFIARRIVGEPAATVAALIFCVLPEVSRLGADGISDSTHLLLLGLAVWAVVEYLARLDAAQVRQRPWSGRTILLSAGIAAGAACLTRPEAMVLPPALLLTLGLFQFHESRRQQRWRLVADLGCFALGMCLVYGPCLIAARQGREFVLHPPNAADSPGENRRAPRETTERPKWKLPDGSRMSFAAKEPTVSIRRRGYAQAAVQFLEELAELFGFWVGSLALVGLWRLRRRQPSRADRFGHVLLALFVPAVLHHTATNGYLSARHLAVWVMIGIGCAGYGLLDLGGMIGRLLGPVGGSRWSSRWAMGAVLVFCLAACVVQSAKPLHASRVGHRMAAEWLTTNAAIPGAVFDTHGWTGLYSGRFTYPADQLQNAICDPRLTYLVLEPAELNFDSDRSRTLRWLIATAARPSATFPEQATPSQAVAVYQWDAGSFRRWFSEHGNEVFPPREKSACVTSGLCDGSAIHPTVRAAFFRAEVTTGPDRTPTPLTPCPSPEAGEGS